MQSSPSPKAAIQTDPVSLFGGTVTLGIVILGSVVLGSVALGPGAVMLGTVTFGSGSVELFVIFPSETYNLPP